MTVGWASAQLQDLIAFVIGGDWGKTPEFDDPDFVDVLCIRGTELRNWHEERGLSAAPRKIKASSLAKRRLQEGNLILEVSGGGPEQPVGRVELIDKQAMAHNAEIPRICTNFFRKLEVVDEIDPAFLSRFLKFFYSTGQVTKYQAGSNNLRNLKYPEYETIEVPVPPRNEQRRIVEKIDTLFARLDKGEEAVREVQKLLTRYRQSVLKSAVTGQLTADWRAQREGEMEHGRDHFAAIQEARQTLWIGRYRKPVPPAISDMPDLPDIWTWASLDSLIYDGPTNGTSPKASNTGEGVKSFKLTATTSGYFIIDENTIKVVGAVIEPDSKYWLKSGDVLIQRGNTIEYVGTAAIFPGPDDEYIYPDLMMRLRFTDELMARWAVAWINFEFAKRYFRKNATGTAGNMPKINGTTLKALAVPIPPRHEIEECMRLIDEAEAKHRPVEQFCESELKRSASLRQSILKDAFAGRLVPQNPNDEPASALLARIASEKSQRTTRRKKTNA